MLCGVISLHAGLVTSWGSVEIPASTSTLRSLLGAPSTCPLPTSTQGLPLSSHPPPSLLSQLDVLHQYARPRTAAWRHLRPRKPCKTRLSQCAKRYPRYGIPHDERVCLLGSDKRALESRMDGGWMTYALISLAGPSALSPRGSKPDYCLGAQWPAEEHEQVPPFVRGQPVHQGSDCAGLDVHLMLARREPSSRSPTKEPLCPLLISCIAYMCMRLFVALCLV